MRARTCTKRACWGAANSVGSNKFDAPRLTRESFEVMKRGTPPAAAIHSKFAGRLNLLKTPLAHLGHDTAWFSWGTQDPALPNLFVCRPS